MRKKNKLYILLLHLATLLYASGASLLNIEIHKKLDKMTIEACEMNEGDSCERLLNSWFCRINDDILKLNIKAADLAWRASTGQEVLKEEGIEIDRVRSLWRQTVCSRIALLKQSILNPFRTRQVYLLCRGIIFNDKEIRSLNTILEKMQNIYTNTEICIPYGTSNGVENAILKDMQKLEINVNENENTSIYGNGYCLSGEPDLERIMRTSRQELVLKWSWILWREAVGPPMKVLYAKMVSIENAAAVKYGYSDTGQVWREELEINNLSGLVDKLFDETRELYTLLHSVVRHFLRKHYGIASESKDTLIQAHLTGNMWAQNWENIIDLILPVDDSMNLDKSIKSKKWTAKDMAKRAEDFYISMGLPPMTEKFWNYSIFKKDNTTKCHGTAANMFLPKDYRMIYCAELSLEDFYVIHHEMGHIQYYMAYEEDLPTIFQDGVNTAFQESIGDAIMLSVMSPQHLERLSLINDKLLHVSPNRHKSFNSTKSISVLLDDLSKYRTESKPNTKSKLDFDDVLLLRQALSKIPHIPYAYVLEKYRWDIFSGKIEPQDYNKAYWEYTQKYQGVTPPDSLFRSEKYFDAGAKFHVPDNTPYIRYFLSSFLQIQMFKGMCKLSVFGKIDPHQRLPIPLHRCDIYGSRIAGKKLREMMSKGSSIKWSEALYILTGEREISSSAFLEYFDPLKKLLQNLIVKNEIYVGWESY